MTSFPLHRQAPSGPPLQKGGIIQVGYDEVESEGEESFGVPAGIMFVPRNVSGDRLRVELSDVRPGNFIEVDFRVTLARVDYYYAADLDLVVNAVVTFDGSEPVVPSDETFAIINSGTGAKMPPVADDDFSDKHSFSSVVNALVPDDSDGTVIVELFSSGSAYLMSGDVSEGLGITLKVSELQTSLVTAAGPGTLVPTSSL